MADLEDYLEKRASTASVSHDGGDEVPLGRMESKQGTKALPSGNKWQLKNRLTPLPVDANIRRAPQSAQRTANKLDRVQSRWNRAIHSVSLLAFHRLYDLLTCKRPARS